jgi:hypothetical protein
MQSPDTSNSRKTTEIKRTAALEELVATGSHPRQSSEISVQPGEGQAAIMANNTSPGSAELNQPLHYINRELSLLAFQWRVLEEAMDENNPLLERFRFLSIVGSNLEEFFMVRVAGLKRQIESGTISTGPDGLTPTEQLDAVSSEVTRILASAHACVSRHSVKLVSRFTSSMSSRKSRRKMPAPISSKRFFLF